MRVETVAEQLLFSTVRVETTGSGGNGIGTAFLFSLESEFVGHGGDVPFLVTNKHVVSDTSTGQFFFTRRAGDQPVIGQAVGVQIDDFESHWYGHPNPQVDIAVMPLDPLIHELENSGRSVFYRVLPNNIVPTTEQLDELDAIEEVLFIGYPSGIHDARNLMPIVRRGITATPLQLDYDGTPTFLIDASVFPGSSGSPVLITSQGWYGTRQGDVVVGGRTYLLGLIASTITRNEKGRIEFDDIPTAQVPIVRTKHMLNLGVVFKASAVIEAAVHGFKLATNSSCLSQLIRVIVR